MAGLAFDLVDWWICGGRFADWLAPPGDGASPSLGVWGTDEERGGEDRQDPLLTSGVGSGR